MTYWALAWTGYGLTLAGMVLICAAAANLRWEKAGWVGVWIGASGVVFVIAWLALNAIQVSNYP